MAAAQHYGRGDGRLMDVAVEVMAMEDVEDPAGRGDDEARVRSVGADGIVLSGALLRELCQRSPRMPVRELAARLHYSRAEIYAWMCGKHTIPLDMYLPILEAISAWRKEQMEWQRQVDAAHARLHVR